jgi:hypothetical protein
MTNDAKFGLVVGLGVVIGIAVVYHHKDPASTKADGTPTAVGSRSSPAHGQYRPEWSPASHRGVAPAQPTAQHIEVAGAAESP